MVVSLTTPGITTPYGHNMGLLMCMPSVAMKMLFGPFNNNWDGWLIANVLYSASCKVNECVIVFMKCIALATNFLDGLGLVCN